MSKRPPIGETGTIKPTLLRHYHKPGCPCLVCQREGAVTDGTITVECPNCHELHRVKVGVWADCRCGTFVMDDRR